MELTSSIYVAGHTGLVGSALVRELARQGYVNLITAEAAACDLREQQAVRDFFAQRRPEYVIIAAARVGGIWANATFPAEFAYDNMMIAANLMQAAYQHGVKKLLFLGSSCIYPKHAPQPLTEDSLLGGYLEPTNQAYAVAKIAGITLAQSYARQYGSRFICAMPTNLYGPGDRFDLKQGHVIPALINRMVTASTTGAPQVTVGGTGRAYREFLHVDDCARALIHLMHHYEGPDIINVGTGVDISIYDLAHMIARKVGYAGSIVWDATFPDGTPRKLLDIRKLSALGWRAQMDLEQGLSETIAWYYENYVTQKNSLSQGDSSSRAGIAYGGDDRLKVHLG